MAKQPTLDELRQQIDELDQTLQRLINRRGELAQLVGQVKQQAGDPNFYRPEREAQLLRHVMQRNDGPIQDKAIAKIFRHILSACLALQRPVRVAFLGPQGTFSNAAANKHFGPALLPKPVDSISQVFSEVSAGYVDYGIVPIENSTAGSISATLDCLRDTAVTICGEVILPIQQCFLVKKDHGTISTIYAHQQSLAQCKQWLDRHYPYAERQTVASNAVAAMRAQQEKHVAALAGEACAEHYDLLVKERHIQDNPNNTTRFIVLGQQQALASGHDKTSLIIYTANEAKALTQVMQCFAENNINITMIEARPRQKQMWSYTFYLDIEGHQTDPAVQQALQQLSVTPSSYEVLGSYPQALAF